ncbi:MAG: hypothetical protein MZU97_11425 [Bacillus subtilis]|nr:hypothetical protein [Bacillus subtilis]
MLSDFIRFNQSLTQTRVQYIQTSAKVFADFKVDLLVTVNAVTAKLSELITDIDRVSTDIISLESKNRLEVADVKKQMENAEITGDYHKYLKGLEFDRFFADYQHDLNIKHDPGRRRREQPAPPDRAQGDRGEPRTPHRRHPFEARPRPRHAREGDPRPGPRQAVRARRSRLPARRGADRPGSPPPDGGGARAHRAHRAPLRRRLPRPGADPRRHPRGRFRDRRRLRPQDPEADRPPP